MIPLSPTITELLGRLDGLRRLAFDANTEIDKRSKEEAESLAAYELAFATAFLAADGSVKERECVAKRDNIVLFRKHQEAVALRRSATAAARTLSQDYETIAAIANAYNRELKVGA